MTAGSKMIPKIIRNYIIKRRIKYLEDRIATYHERFSPLVAENLSIFAAKLIKDLRKQIA